MPTLLSLQLRVTQRLWRHYELEQARQAKANVFERWGRFYPIYIINPAQMYLIVMDIQYFSQVHHLTSKSGGCRRARARAHIYISHGSVVVIGPEHGVGPIALARSSPAYLTEHRSVWIVLWWFTSGLILKPPTINMGAIYTQSLYINIWNIVKPAYRDQSSNWNNWSLQASILLILVNFKHVWMTR